MIANDPRGKNMIAHTAPSLIGSNIYIFLKISRATWSFPHGT